jgi:hypothetical protein
MFRNSTILREHTSFLTKAKFEKKKISKITSLLGFGVAAYRAMYGMILVCQSVRLCIRDTSYSLHDMLPHHNQPTK